jgi:3-oxoacyl-[acyl-carrier-protein] synthase III
MVETTDEWIYSRVGIRKRHVAEKGMATSHMAVEAAKRRLDSRGIVATDVDAIVVATVRPDILLPATACLVQDKFAVRKMVEASQKVLMRIGVSVEELSCFIPHQANKRIITSSAERMGIPLEKVIINIDRYGNTTAGTIPLAMGTAVEENRLHKD